MTKYFNSSITICLTHILPIWHPWPATTTFPRYHSLNSTRVTPPLTTHPKYNNPSPPMLTISISKSNLHSTKNTNCTRGPASVPIIAWKDTKKKASSTETIPTPRWKMPLISTSFASQTLSNKQVNPQKTIWVMSSITNKSIAISEIPKIKKYRN